MDFIFLIGILFIGFVFVQNLKKRLNKFEFKYLNILWVYHLIFGVYVAMFVATDARGYWFLAKEISWEFFLYNITSSKGTNFMYAIHYFPANLLGLSYFSGTMLYTFIGFIGISCFYFLATKLIPYNSSFAGLKLFPLLFFFPNLHFWSVAAGKDTLVIFAIGVFSYLYYLKKNLLLIIPSLLIFAVRPHVFMFLVLSFGFIYIFSSSIEGFKKVTFSLLLFSIAIFVLPTILDYAKIEEINVEQLSNFAIKKTSGLSRSHTDSSVDISSYSFPVKIFTFLYRPFFFDINGLPALLASFENLLLLLLTIKIFRNKLQKSFKSSPILIKGLVIFLVLGTLSFSQILGNLGIMLRMRNMFLPGMILFILWSLSYQKKIKV